MKTDDEVREWISEKLSIVAEDLSESVEHPESFACGYDMGTKSVLIELTEFLDLEDNYEL